MNTIYLITFFFGQSLLLLSFFFFFIVDLSCLSIASLTDRIFLLSAIIYANICCSSSFSSFFSSSRIYSIHQEIILLHIPYFFAVKKKKYDFFITSNASVLYCLSLFLFVIIVLTETFLVL